MKKLIIGGLILFTFNAVSQTKQEVEYFQDLYEMDKVQVITNIVNPSEEHKTDFWNIYDEYENERQALGLKRLEMMQQYVENYNNYTAENVGEVITAMQAQSKATEDLIVKYYKKMKKEIDPVTAAQFYQLENYFLAEIRVAIFEGLPIINELKD